MYHFLFNKTEIDVQQLREPVELTAAFSRFWKKNEAIRKHLHAFLPGYLEKANGLIKIISEL